jgi:hypothetical protein
VNVILGTVVSDIVRDSGAQPATAERPLTDPVRAVGEALARVQEAAIEVPSCELRGCLEEAIEAIDTVTAVAGVAGAADLISVADALEGALDELEQGKVANLALVIEQAQSIICP